MCKHVDDDDNIEDDEQDNHVPVFTMKELIFAIASLKKGKSADGTEIKAKELTKKR